MADPSRISLSRFRARWPQRQEHGFRARWPQRRKPGFRARWPQRRKPGFRALSMGLYGTGQPSSHIFELCSTLDGHIHIKPVREIMRTCWLEACTYSIYQNESCVYTKCVDRNHAHNKQSCACAYTKCAREAMHTFNAWVCTCKLYNTHTHTRKSDVTAEYSARIVPSANTCI